MPKKTATRTKKRRADSPTKQSGLIDKGKNSQQSARTKSALDNHSHRTTLGISCERTPLQHLDARTTQDVSVRINGLSPQRSTASCPCYAHAHLRERAYSGNCPSTLLHAPPTNSTTSTHLSPASDPNLPATLISLTPGTHIHLGSQTPRGRDAHQKPSNSQKLSAHEGTLSITTTSKNFCNTDVKKCRSISTMHPHS